MPPEDTGAGQPQAGGSAQPQAGTTTGGQAPPAGTGQAPASGTQSGTGDQGGAAGTGETPEQALARLTAENAELRKEQGGNRTKLREFERAAAAAAQAGKTAEELAAERTSELEQANTRLQGQLRAQAVQSAALTAATKLNFRNPELAYRLLNVAELEFDDETGAPKGVELELRELATAEPYLIKPQGGDFGGGTRGEPAGATGGKHTMNELVRAALGKG